MAGYNQNTWRSNNAEDAINRGLLTSGEVAKIVKKATKLPVTATIIQNEIRYDEWHHTSNRYNKTFYYDPARIDEIIATLKAMNWKDEEPAKPQHIKVTYPVWGGSLKSPYIASYVTEIAVMKGDWAILPNGSKKKLSGTAVSYQIVA